MNADDRDLISGLFARMGNVGALDKDREAEDFIHRQMRENPDAPYLLVQSVLVQEQALQKADARIKELEARVCELEAAPKEPSTVASVAGGTGASYVAPRASSGFGKTGNGVGGDARAASAVPPVGRAGVENVRPQGERANGASRGQPDGSRAGGGFMAQAMTTAAGVAGGMLLASGISSLLGGTASAASNTATTDTATTTDTQSDTDNAATASQDQGQSDTVQSDNDGAQAEAHQDAAYDDGDGGWGDWGGGDDWGGGFDI